MAGNGKLAAQSRPRRQPVSFQGWQPETSTLSAFGLAPHRYR
jgi:hypothetical protein